MQPIDAVARCHLKVNKDLALIRVVDTGASIKKLTYGLKYTLVDILGIVGALKRGKRRTPYLVQF